MGTRRRARECALQILYGIDWTSQEPQTASDLFWSSFAGERPAAYDDVRTACDVLVQGVASHREAIDQILVDASHNWKLDRMSVVDRNLLRLGTYELLWREDVPPKVVLNEAIEIAKKYGNADSGSFVNGVLHHVSLRKPAGAARERPQGGSGRRADRRASPARPRGTTPPSLRGDDGGGAGAGPGVAASDPGQPEQDGAP